MFLPSSASLSIPTKWMDGWAVLSGQRVPCRNPMSGEPARRPSCTVADSRTTLRSCSIVLYLMPGKRGAIPAVVINSTFSTSEVRSKGLTTRRQGSEEPIDSASSFSETWERHRRVWTRPSAGQLIVDLSRSLAISLFALLYFRALVHRSAPRAPSSLFGSSRPNPGPSPVHVQPSRRSLARSPPSTSRHARISSLAAAHPLLSAHKALPPTQTFHPTLTLSTRRARHPHPHPQTPNAPRCQHSTPASDSRASHPQHSSTPAPPSSPRTLPPPRPHTRSPPRACSPILTGTNIPSPSTRSTSPGTLLTATPPSQPTTASPCPPPPPPPPQPTQPSPPPPADVASPALPRHPSPARARARSPPSYGLPPPSPSVPLTPTHASARSTSVPLLPQPRRSGAGPSPPQPSPPHSPPGTGPTSRSHSPFSPSSPASSSAGGRWSRIYSTFCSSGGTSLSSPTRPGNYTPPPSTPPRRNSSSSSSA
ncbi:hypothetical protein CALVIDRAFT_72027 [Calocera viscosa TUFC12733]|uniref:Uncharacterized protein n=1 Tax=Calocera viscosa (strain TUFC12733) TaxID=1330018 RepID=A0A167NBB4_CALVF|nr:hypothetical protein CALVIDRAFT_72027 [Calocera viscosa TUFC12733]